MVTFSKILTLVKETHSFCLVWFVLAHMEKTAAFEGSSSFSNERPTKIVVRMYSSPWNPNSDDYCDELSYQILHHRDATRYGHK